MDYKTGKRLEDIMRDLYGIVDGDINNGYIPPSKETLLDIAKDLRETLEGARD